MHAAVKRHVRGTGIGLLVAISLTLPSAIGAAPAPVTARDSPAVAHASVRGALDADKAAAFDWLDRNADAMKALGMELWRTPELSFREFKSSRALIRYLGSNGFAVTANAAGLPTAFVASSGSGKPVVAFWTEEDALAGMSQKAVPAREPVVPGGPGHACWHNLIGPSTAAAAVAVAQFLQRTGATGTIRVYGTPAEETGGGKDFMLDAGMFKDVDVLLGWHPSTNTRTEFEYSKAMAEMHFHFKGVASHASVSPDQGRSALHAVELMNAGVNSLREQLKEDARVQYVISNGGGEPNVIPADAESWYIVRANKHDEVTEIVQWISEIARGAAMMTRTQVDVRVDNDQPEVMPNRPLAEVLDRNLHMVGAPIFREEDKTFARRLLEGTGWEPRPTSPDVVTLPQEATQEAYSTDLGNASWTIPTERFAVATSPYLLAPHSWQATVNAATAGLEAIPIAAKVLAATAIDLFRSPAAIDAAKKDLTNRTSGRAYKLLTPSNRKPPVYHEGSPD
ncbi:MAG TPA: amidohydrolase [Vicinamibacterales bacterium]|nr:amidohydrolase [Vicinamibacterales bacterium]